MKLKVLKIRISLHTVVYSLTFLLIIIMWPVINVLIVVLVLVVFVKLVCFSKVITH